MENTRIRSKSYCKDKAERDYFVFWSPERFRAYFEDNVDLGDIEEKQL